MTKREFLKILRKTREIINWERADYYVGTIRGKHKSKKKCEFCPITAVYYYAFGQALSIGLYDYCGSQLGLKPSTYQKIVHEIIIGDMKFSGR